MRGRFELTEDLECSSADRGNDLTRTFTIIAGLAVAALTLHDVSDWWEKAWATRLNTELSPDSCFRLEEYKPYWILPPIFHARPWHDGPTEWPVYWGAPRFYRLYVADTGILLGETPTIDSHLESDITWGGWSFHGGTVREVTIGGYPLATTAHCTDLRSRKLMHDYYAKIAASRKPIYKGKIRVN